MNALHVACGAGGSTSGFESAGVKTAYAFDLSPTVIATHRANFPDAPAEVRDVRTVAASDLPHADIFCCGIPCEAYSIAGQRLGMAGENGFSPAIARLLRETQPRYVFLENVSPYQGSPAAAMIRDALSGYSIAEVVLAHANYGVCQKRRRWHLIAARATSAPLPVPTHSEHPGLMTRPWVLFREIRDPNPDTSFLSARAWRGIIRRQARSEMLMLDRGDGSAYNKCSIVDDDDLLSTVLASWWKGPCRNQATVIFDNFRFRGPTRLEAQRAQGFPDDYVFQGNAREVWEQIGRAVPPPVAEAVARAFVNQSSAASWAS